MIDPSLIYIGVTILLALVDAFRIKAVWGKKGNIKHWVSTVLSIWSSFVVWGFCHLEYLGAGRKPIPKCLWFMASCFFIRLAIFDVALNLFRLLTKTNPTLRLDYESDTTSSYVDKYTFKLGFWEKRAIGVAGWFVCWIIYHVIFK